MYVKPADWMIQQGGWEIKPTSTLNVYRKQNNPQPEVLHLKRSKRMNISSLVFVFILTNLPSNILRSVSLKSCQNRNIFQQRCFTSVRTQQQFYSFVERCITGWVSGIWGQAGAVHVSDCFRCSIFIFLSFYCCWIFLLHLCEVHLGDLTEIIMFYQSAELG